MAPTARPPPTSSARPIAPILAPFEIGKARAKFGFQMWATFSSVYCRQSLFSFPIA